MGSPVGGDHSLLIPNKPVQAAPDDGVDHYVSGRPGVFGQYLAPNFADGALDRGGDGQVVFLDVGCLAPMPEHRIDAVAGGHDSHFQFLSWSDGQGMCRCARRCLRLNLVPGANRLAADSRHAL